MKRVKKSGFATETARECSNYSTEMEKAARPEFFRDSQPHRLFVGLRPPRRVPSLLIYLMYFLLFVMQKDGSLGVDCPHFFSIHYHRSSYDHKIL